MLCENILFQFGIERKKKMDRQYEIRTLHIEEVREIYHQYLQFHFVEEERKPLKAIERMWEQNQYFALGMFEKEQKSLAGYAFFSSCIDGDMVLLDYFAMLEKERGKGLGSLFLQHMQDTLQEGFRGILIETEDVSFAKNEQELEERNRRNDFYLRNGAKKTGITSRIYDARYEVYVLPFGEMSMLDLELLSKLSFENIYGIYQYMIPGEKNEKFVSFWKKQE